MLCLRTVVASLEVVTAVVVVIFTEAAVQQDMTYTRVHNSLTWMPVPWLGALTLGTEYKNATEKVVPVIMISDKTGIADARSIAPLNKYNWKKIRKSINVMFLAKENIPWYAKVKHFILHPEFSEETLSTVAVLILEYDLIKFAGAMPEWPFKFTNTLYKGDQLFTIGYTDQNLVLEQVVYRMDYVQLSDCKYFYITEELDTKWMRPKHYHCYNVRFSKETCVFIPGMALIRYNDGKYTLIGMSVWGPGCSLPARFIDFEPFVPWIMSKMVARRLWNAEEIGVNTFDDQQRWTLERLKGSKELVLRPLKRKDREDLAQEILHGECKANDMQDGKLIYREATNFTTRRRPYNAKIKAIAVYALSLYDLKYNKTHYTCIQVLASCKQKSDSKLEFTKSFDEISHPLQPYIKTLPVQHSIYRDVYPPYVHTVKETWEKYNYEILGSDITQLVFRFEFIKEAYIEVRFFGNRTDAYRKIETSTTAVPRLSQTRTRRPYHTETKNPPRPYYYYDQYGNRYTTLSVTRRRPTSTTRTAKGTKKKTNSSHWWNQWWNFHKEQLPKVHMDWWLG